MKGCCLWRNSWDRRGCCIGEVKKGCLSHVTKFWIFFNAYHPFTTALNVSPSFSDNTVRERRVISKPSELVLVWISWKGACVVWWSSGALVDTMLLSFSFRLHKAVLWSLMVREWFFFFTFLGKVLRRFCYV